MRVALRTLGDLGPDFILAPERHVLVAQSTSGVPLGDLVVERRERIDPNGGAATVILDTTHAKDGILDVANAIRDVPGAKSAKKRAFAGDVVVSRLRPYLRQVALVHPSSLAFADDRPLALSTEFYVLAPREPGRDLAFLVPFLLSANVQAALSAAQEGGHHPRVPLSSLFALRVPRAAIRARVDTSRAVIDALSAAYAATARLRALLGG